MALNRLHCLLFSPLPLDFSHSGSPLLSISAAVWLAPKHICILQRMEQEAPCGKPHLCIREPPLCPALTCCLSLLASWPCVATWPVFLPLHYCYICKQNLSSCWWCWQEHSSWHPSTLNCFLCSLPSFAFGCPIWFLMCSGISSTPADLAEVFCFCNTIYVPQAQGLPVLCY